MSYYTFLRRFCTRRIDGHIFDGHFLDRHPLWSRTATLASALLLLLHALVQPVAANDVTYVCDSGTDAIYRMVDSDGNGMIDPATEVVIFYDDTSPGPDLSTPLHLLTLGDSVLVADAGTVDSVLRLTDLNDDGDANDAGEVIAYYDDTAPGIDLSTANGLAHGPAGSVLVSDDGASVRSILRLTDINGDGDANDDGELAIYYDQSAVAPTPVVTDPEAIAATTTGIVYVTDTATGRIVRLSDTNGDGDALDAGEATVFFEGTAPATLTDLDTLQLDGSVLVAVDEDNGTVLRLSDSNGDGDALDAGEAVLWVDGAANPAASDPNDAATIGNGRLLLADGAIDGLLVAEDLDGSGAVENGEFTAYFDDAGALLATPSGVLFVAGAPPSPAPQVSTVSPPQGPQAGGTLVTIAGSSLLEVTSVQFGGIVATFTVIDDNTIEVLTPPMATAGSVDVAVESPHGAVVAVAAFEFVAPLALTITTVDPPFGATSGGDTVALFGAGWDVAAPITVTFGGLVAPITMVTTTMIAVQTPRHPTGLVHVELDDGMQSTIASGAFEYRTPFVRGDSNVNGNVDLGDAITQLTYLYVPGAPQPTCLDTLDTNDDGEVDLGDPVTLLTYLFSGGPPPATPFPDVGIDTTAAGPGCAAYDPLQP
ncbi:MAG: IPT/TIG domain-containing protein [Planctomycetota bacterium]